MLDCILSSNKHILTTARAKSDTALVANEKNKMVPRAFGLKPELRDNIEYDFDIVFNVDKLSHSLIVDKGIPGLDPVFDIATPDTGKIIFDLFNADAIVPARTVQDVIDSIRKLCKTQPIVQFVQLKLNGRKMTDIPFEDLLKLELDTLEEIKNLKLNHSLIYRQTRNSLPFVKGEWLWQINQQDKKLKIRLMLLSKYLIMFS